jgi:hypothetical protein
MGCFNHVALYRKYFTGFATRASAFIDDLSKPTQKKGKRNITEFWYFLNNPSNFRWQSCSRQCQAQV